MIHHNPQKWLPLLQQFEYTQEFEEQDAHGEKRLLAEEAIAALLASHFSSSSYFTSYNLYRCVHPILSSILEHFPRIQPLPPDLSDLLYQPLCCWNDTCHNQWSKAGMAEMSKELLIFALASLHPTWVATYSSEGESDAKQERCAYKLVRRYQYSHALNQKQRSSLWTVGMCPNGARNHLRNTQWSWEYAYPLTGVVEQPNMLVFDTCEHALKYYYRQFPSSSNSVEIWKVQIFEPLPVLTKELPSDNKIWEWGHTFWKNWQDPEKLKELERRVIFRDPPEGTRVCQKLQMMDCLPLPPSPEMIKRARELTEANQVWEEEIAAITWERIEQTAQEFGNIAVHFPEHQLIIISGTSSEGPIKQFKTTPREMVYARRYAVRLSEEDESCKSFAKLRAECLEE